jgi:hypothetical protein
MIWLVVTKLIHLMRPQRANPVPSREFTEQHLRRCGADLRPSGCRKGGTGWPGKHWSLENLQVGASGAWNIYQPEHAARLRRPHRSQLDHYSRSMTTGSSGLTSGGTAS